MPNLVGTGNNQVPTNAMLGGLAYQDTKNASVESVEVGSIAAIKAFHNVAATCMFVYDTSRDSDGGAWRKKLNTQSWYIEELGTASRGHRKEFPSLAVIVGTTSEEIIIYDGDDPNLPMYLRFQGNNSMLYEDPTCVTAINGCIYWGQTSYGLGRYNLIGDSIGRYRNHATSRGYKMPDKRIGGRITVAATGNQIVHPFKSASLLGDQVLDVKVTVTTDAPTDPDTGLPRPYIVVQNNVGVNVIKDSGFSGNIEGISHGYPSSIDIGIIPEQEAFIAHHNGATSGQTLDVISVRTQFRMKGVHPSDFAAGGIYGARETDGHGSSNRVEPRHATNGGSVAIGRYYGYGHNSYFNPPAPFKWDSWGSCCKNVLWKEGSIIAGTSNKGIVRIKEHFQHLQGGMKNWCNANINTGWMHGDCHGCYAGNANGQSGTSSGSIGDLSHEGNDANINGGSLSYGPVATGAGLVGWYGFTNSIYARATQSHDMGNGTAFSFMGWFNTTYTGSYQYICSVSKTDGSGRAGLSLDTSSGDPYFWDSTNSSTGFRELGIGDLRDGQWHHIAGSMSYGSSATQKKFYVDGQLVKSDSKGIVNLSSCGVWNVGHYTSNGSDVAYSFGGQLALVKFSGGTVGDAGVQVPTDEQMMQIYNEEKPLFNEGAQCNLYGGSSTVVAQDYDDSTGILHVGTSGGRSDFKGLVRINNTTTAVTTDGCLSAARGLIVEQ